MASPSLVNPSVSPNELAEQLQRAYDQTGRKTDRNALPTVFEELKLFKASGRYPYDAEVVAEIALKYGLATDSKQRFDHQAVHDAKDIVLIQLHTEVYLAGKQCDVLEMQAKEQEQAAEGYTPITQLVPEAGMKIQIAGDETVYRLKQIGRDWALLAPGQRTHGLSLNALVQKQRAYEKAVERGRTAMDGPGVRGFKLVADKTVAKTSKRSPVAAAIKTEAARKITEAPASAPAPALVEKAGTATPVDDSMTLEPMLDFGDFGR